MLNAQCYIEGLEAKVRRTKPGARRTETGLRKRARLRTRRLGRLGMEEPAVEKDEVVACPCTPLPSLKFHAGRKLGRESKHLRGLSDAMITIVR
jgi:hypothetical protein